VASASPPYDPALAPDRRPAIPATGELATRRLTLAHLWIAFGTFAVASLLGVWQMWARSPLAAPAHTAENYFQAVTLHGVIMAYVLTTFFIMGFGYYVAETALKRPLPAPMLAWVAYGMGIVGVLMAALSVVSGNASVLYTFYPPITATPWFYIGLVLVVVGSWIWAGLMIAAMVTWKRLNPGAPVPLAMFATTANAVMWLWTTVGVAAELLFQVIPAAFGWVETIDVGLSRTLFSWTLHAIVYFWLFPAYIAFYTMAPQAAGGRLYSDTMGRLTFILFLLYSLPVGLHHLFMDPEHSTGFKFIQMVLTALVAVPTLLTVFTITASMEIAGRMRGGRGLLGWIGALPWKRPMMLATGLAFLMLFFGGGGGLINMSYGMNAMIHNTSWVTAHFHLIFGGTVVIMYFAIAYAIWPTLTGREFASRKPLLLQLWLWFIGMMVMTLPWHYTGLQGQWRRVAAFDYSDPMVASWGPWVIVSLVGGLVLGISALLFIYNLARLHFPKPGRIRAPAQSLRYAVAVHPPARIPRALNGFAMWNIFVAILMAAAYGYPIAQFFIDPPPAAVVHRTYGG
jgi:cytochrome c oxidase subunit I